MCDVLSDDFVESSVLAMQCLISYHHHRRADCVNKAYSTYSIVMTYLLVVRFKLRCYTVIR